MKPAVSMLGIGILVLSAVVIGNLLQVAPTPDSYHVAEQLSGGIAYTDLWPNTATLATTKAGNLTGISLYLKRPPSDVLYVTWGLSYYATCNGTTAGSGSASVQVDNGGWKWFTLPLGNGRVVASGVTCSVFVARSGSPTYALWWSVAGPNSPNRSEERRVGKEGR